MKAKQIRAWYILLALGMILGSMAVIAASNEEFVQKYLEDGDKALASGNLTSAKQEYEKALLLAPRNFTANLKMGYIALLESNYKKSLEYLSLACEVDEEMVAAEKITKNDPTPYFYLGLAYEGLEQYSLALAKYQFADLYGSKDPELYFHRALCYAKMKQKEQALAMGEKYLKEKGLTRQSAGLLMLVYISADYYLEALNLAQAVDDPDIWTAAGQTLLFREQYELAVKALQASLGKNPKNDKALYLLGYVYYQSYRDQEAIEQFKNALKLKPNDSEYLGALGYMYADLGINLDEAERLCDQALLEADDKKDSNLWDNKGWVYFKQGKLEKALDALESARICDPRNCVVYYHLACVYQQKNNLQKAKEMLDKALALPIQGKRLRQDIADLKTKLGIK